MNYKVCLHKIGEEKLPYTVTIKNAQSKERAIQSAKEVIAEAGYWGIGDMSVEDKLKELVVSSVEEVEV